MVELKRGDVVTVAVRGDYGKPRPALVVQSDLFLGSHPSVTLLPITSEILDAPYYRITVEPGPANGLRTVSQVMVDKALTVPREKVGRAIGSLDDETLVRVSRAIAVWMGIGS